MGTGPKSQRRGRRGGRNAQQFFVCGSRDTPHQWITIISSTLWVFCSFVLSLNHHTRMQVMPKACTTLLDALDVPVSERTYAYAAVQKGVITGRYVRQPKGNLFPREKFAMGIKEQ